MRPVLLVLALCSTIPARAAEPDPRPDLDAYLSDRIVLRTGYAVEGSDETPVPLSVALRDMGDDELAARMAKSERGLSYLLGGAMGFALAAPVGATFGAIPPGWLTPSGQQFRLDALVLSAAVGALSVVAVVAGIIQRRAAPSPEALSAAFVDYDGRLRGEYHVDPDDDDW